LLENPDGSVCVVVRQRDTLAGERGGAAPAAERSGGGRGTDLDLDPYLDPTIGPLSEFPPAADYDIGADYDLPLDSSRRSQGGGSGSRSISGSDTRRLMTRIAEGDARLMRQF
jgi:hypothetical protein